METISYITVKEEDIDLLDHVNNSVYITYLEIARTDWYIKMGINMKKEIIGQDLGTVLRKLEVLYIKEAKLGDQLKVITRPGHLGKTSFTFEQAIFNQRDEKVTEATAVNVMIDLSARKSIPVIDKIGRYFHDTMTIKLGKRADG